MYFMASPDSEPADPAIARASAASVPKEQVYQPTEPELMLPPGNKRTPPANMKYIMAIAIALVAVIAIVSILILNPKGTSSTITTTSIRSTTGNTTSKSTTTTISATVISLKGCGTITNPGSYLMKSDIRTGLGNGSCIAINASNVNITCAGYVIEGSGPFDALPPFTYGIYVNGQSNVSVHGCTISNFSFGVYSLSASNLNIYNNNISTNYVSNIYLNATSSSVVNNNTLSHALSTKGSLYLTGGSQSNRISNNTITFNQFYGINVSSSGNKFYNNVINSTPQDAFYCSIRSSYPSSSTAQSNICNNNYGCGFVSCSGINTPANISKIGLSFKINGCGSIAGPGDYQMQGNLNMGAFINTSNPLTTSAGIPCIRVSSSNVTLDCAGFGIYNSTYAIAAYNSSNVTIKNCQIPNPTEFGISLYSVINSTIKNNTVSGANYGIYLQSSYSNNVTSSTISHSAYGLVLNNSRSNNLVNLIASKNAFGVFTERGSTGNNFIDDIAINDSRIDFYASQNLTAPAYNFVSGTNCYSTNTQWAQCTIIESPSLSYTPVLSCRQIGTPGNYSLTGNLLNAQPNCITIISSNVTFSCGGHTIQSEQPPLFGAGILVSGSNNVTVSNCGLLGFVNGAIGKNSNKLTFNGLFVNGSTTGIIINSSRNSRILNNTITGAANESISLVGVNKSTIMGNRVSYGIGTSIGLFAKNSQYNLILNNSVTQAYYGYEFTGQSMNNTVSNNTASLDSNIDYICNGNGNVNAQSGGINFGTSKLGCKWLAAVDTLSPNPDCVEVSNSGAFDLGSDFEYSYGSICYTSLSNATSINCEGHTVIASAGGTFAKFVNSQGSEIEGCYLKGFTAPIISVNSSIKVFNNTIIDQPNGSTAVNISGGLGGSVNYNNMSTPGANAIRLYNTSEYVLRGNNVSVAQIAYLVSNSVGTQIISNLASPLVGEGLLLQNSVAGYIKANYLYPPKSLSCIGSSAIQGNFTDLGGNSCTSSQSNCPWISQSPSC